jgi:hypothetical protein
MASSATGDVRSRNREKGKVTKGKITKGKITKGQLEGCGRVEEENLGFPGGEVAAPETENAVAVRQFTQMQHDVFWGGVQGVLAHMMFLGGGVRECWHT